MIAEPDVANALGDVRLLVEGDGAGLELVSVEPSTGTVQLRLLLEGVSCLECVMPRPILEDVATNVLRRKVPDVARVSIEDPRESEQAPAGH
jgi:Fe-S cluster biogenesis protein NfuA